MSCTLRTEQRHLYTVCKCLRGQLQDDIIRLGLSLGLHLPSLMKMKMLPEEMVHAWLMRMDSVTEQSGLPTTDSLIQVLQDLNLSEAVDKVKTNIIIR